MGDSSSASVKTRNSVKTKLSEVVGPGKEFILSEVPTWRAILQKGILLREQKLLVESVHSSSYPVKDLCSDLASAVLGQWKVSNVKFCSPVTIERRSIEKKIIEMWNKVTQIAWYKPKGDSAQKTLSDLDKLYDICVCKHSIYLCGSPDSDCGGCPQKAHIKCDCVKAYKIPRLELRWLYYQRLKTSEVSKTQISVVDSKETKRLDHLAKRKDKSQEMEQQEITAKKQRFKGATYIDDENTDEDDSADTYEDYTCTR